MVKAILTKPLDGHPEGARREFDQPDFDRLKGMGAVRALTEAEEAEEPADDAEEGEKAAPPVDNKAAPPVLNKAADIGRASRKPGA